MRRVLKAEVNALMARNKQEEPPLKTDGWMATFSDLMNLLLCFFVLLFAMSSVDTDKWQQLVASFSSNYSILQSGGEGLQEGQLIASGASQLTQIGDYYAQIGLNQDGSEDSNKDSLLEIEKKEYEESEQMGDKIEQILENKGLESEVEVQVTQTYVSINMKGALLFESASADLTADANRVLTEVAGILKNYEDNHIKIEGYTDTIPINTEKYPSNNELSYARALAVFYFLTNENGLSNENFDVSGYGERHPIASNDTAEGRAQNRRVEIKIYNSYNSK